ncbi:MAG: ABC-2 family transporter protein, partial [Chloroflexaceae bacterium]|nr:ABC-2 family transporter protein [Chloroflexaceae bacterium]
PDWARQIANVLPFQWTFGFPIEALVSNLSPDQLLFGLAMQGLWIAIGAALVAVVWRVGVRQFTSVGN